MLEDKENVDQARMTQRLLHLEPQVVGEQLVRACLVTAQFDSSSSFIQVNLKLSYDMEDLK